MVDEKKVKKWEYGLIYPSLDEIYIISELYMFPAVNIITAKNNSLKQGMDSIHYTLIKTFCYITGLSMKIGMVAMYLIIAIVFVYAVHFFIQCAEMFMSSRRKIILKGEKTMYINDGRLNVKKIINGIELFCGIAGFIIFGSTMIYVILEGGTNDDVVNFFYILTAINIALIVLSIRSKRFIGSIFFYARYFEGDLDGKIKPSDMVSVVGKSASRIKKELRWLKIRGYMKNYKLVNKGNETIIELESIVTKCECKNCGAPIDKKVYFAGNCPYCGGLDVFAKELTK